MSSSTSFKAGHVPHDWTGRLSTVALSFCAAANLIFLAFLAARTEDFSCFTRLQLRPDTPRPNGAGVAVAAPAITTVPSPLNFESLARLDLKQAASGIRASDWCRESCRATFRCEQHEVKLCYWHEHMENATCTCRDELFFPSEWFRGALKSTKVNAQSGPKLHPWFAESLIFNLLLWRKMLHFTGNQQKTKKQKSKQKNKQTKKTNPKNKQTKKTNKKQNTNNKQNTKQTKNYKQ